MKKTFIILLLIGISSSQEIVKNEIDEFTNDKKIFTSWASVITSMSITSWMRVRQINETLILDYRIMWPNTVFSVNKGDQIMIKFSNEKLVKLKNRTYKITSLGGGAVGFSGSKCMGIILNYYISKEQLKIFQTQKIEKIRLYTSDAYLEYTIKERKTKSIIKLANLIKP